MSRSLRLTLIAFCLAVPFVAAQTQTVANPDGDGGSIVQVVTTDIDGLPVTNAVDTIPPGVATNPAGGAATLTPGVPPVATTPGVPGAATATTTTTPAVPAVPTATTTRQQVTTPGNLGPVPQPPPTVAPGQGQTSYQYTTVDALGQTTVIQDIFTPTYNSQTPQSSPAKGTILSPSQFSALIGTHTAGGPTSGVVSWRMTPMGAGGIFALVCGVIAGAFAVL